MSTSAIQLHRWSRREYDRMIASGVFHPEARLELIDGEIYHMTPQGSLHATAIQLVVDALRAVFHENYAIRIQLPLALDDHSEPEPDIAVVTGTARDYKNAHPKTAILIVEIADASLSFDLENKRRLYARAGIPEYWIINLIDQRVEVFKQPKASNYLDYLTFSVGESLAPIGHQQANIDVSDILP